jgi:hypothetical protein
MPTPNSGHANSRRANRPGPLCVVANNKQQQQQQHKSAAARTAVGAARPAQSQACQAAWLLRVAAGLACPRPDSAQPSIQAWQVSAVPRGGCANTSARTAADALRSAPECGCRRLRSRHRPCTCQPHLQSLQHIGGRTKSTHRNGLCTPRQQQAARVDYHHTCAMQPIASESTGQSKAAFIAAYMRVMPLRP